LPGIDGSDVAVPRNFGAPGRDKWLVSRCFCLKYGLDITKNFKKISPTLLAWRLRLHHPLPPP